MPNDNGVHVYLADEGETFDCLLGTIPVTDLDELVEKVRKFGVVSQEKDWEFVDVFFSAEPDEVANVVIQVKPRP